MYVDWLPSNPTPLLDLHFHWSLQLPFVSGLGAMLCCIIYCFVVQSQTLSRKVQDGPELANPSHYRRVEVYCLGSKLKDFFFSFTTAICDLDV